MASNGKPYSVIAPVPPLGSGGSPGPSNKDADAYAIANRHAKRATLLDQNQDYAQALVFYKIAIESYLLARKNSDSRASHETITGKINQLLARAECIKQYLQHQQQQQTLQMFGPAMGSGSGEEGSSAPGQAARQAKFEGEASASKERLRSMLDQCVIKEKPNVPMHDVVGLDLAKDILDEAIVMSVRYPHQFGGGGLGTWRGVLLYGPPGTGKSHLARAVATEMNVTFLCVSSSDLTSKWVGESEKLVRAMFEMAQEESPCIIFIDEVDSLCSRRQASESDSALRIKTEFMVRMDGVKTSDKKILVLAATNRPWELDDAILRRFEKRIYIPLPNHEARKGIFRVCLAKMTTTQMPTDQELEELADVTEGYSGDDIRAAAKEAMHERVRKVKRATHFRPVLMPSPDVPETFDIYYTPCEPDSPSPPALRMTHLDIEDPNRVIFPELTPAELLEAVKRTKPAASMVDLSEYELFTAKSGQMD